VRAHWLTTVGGVVNRFTGITQTRHFVMAITVDDSAADPQTRRCWQRRRREKGAHSMDTLAARRKCWSSALGGPARPVARGLFKVIQDRFNRLQVAVREADVDDRSSLF